MKLKPGTILLILAFWSSATGVSGQFKDFRYAEELTIEACRQDLQYYKEKLEKEHPNLYVYTSKADMNAFFDSLSAGIVYNQNKVNFYNLITLCLARIKDGHTHIYPDERTLEAYRKEAPYFPFQIRWEEKRMIATHIFTRDRRVEPGTEILFINGITSSFIYDVLFRRQIRDGFNTTYPEWILHKYFSDYYSYHIGNPDTFNLVIKFPDNALAEITVRGLPKDSILYYKEKYYGIPAPGKSPGQGLILSVDTAMSTAIIKVRDFHNEVLRKKYRQKFKPVIRRYFAEIQKRSISHLILDLRDNQGGNIQNGQELLSHLFDTSFQVLRSISAVDKVTYYIPEARLERVNGPLVGLYPPSRHPFTGSLYVLINGGSFSNSAIVASALKTHNRAVFIGEESGGNAVLFAGGGKYTPLPNSQFKILVPDLQYDMRGYYNNRGHGVMPDYPVRMTAEDIISGYDRPLQFALDLIKRKTNP